MLNTKIKQLEAKLAELGVNNEEVKSEVSSNDVVPQIINNEVSFVEKIALFYFWDAMGSKGSSKFGFLGN